jgi:hypothetical protein
MVSVQKRSPSVDFRVKSHTRSKGITRAELGKKDCRLLERVEGSTAVPLIVETGMEGSLSVSGVEQ